MFHPIHSRGCGKDGFWILEQERFDLGPPGVCIAPAHLDQGLREASVEQQIAREVGVGPSAHVEQAEERATEALAESNTIGSEVVRGHLSDIDARPQDQ